MKKDIMLEIKYQSPDTDIPNELLISEPVSLRDLFFEGNMQINFLNGGYLMQGELEPEYTEIRIISKCV
jgi:hypothetical protein